MGLPAIATNFGVIVSILANHLGGRPQRMMELPAPIIGLSPW
jgi:hypothetical protein